MDKLELINKLAEERIQLDEVKNTISQINDDIEGYKGMIEQYKSLITTSQHSINKHKHEQQLIEDKIARYQEQLNMLNESTITERNVVTSLVGYCRESKHNNDCTSQSGNLIDKYGPMMFFMDSVNGVTNPRNRLGFKSMINYLKQSQIDAVCVNSLDRLGRTPSIIKQAIKDILNYTNKIYVIREDIVIDLLNLSKYDKLILEIGKAAEKERLVIGQRLNEGLKIAIKNGLKIGRPAGSTKSNEQKEKEYSYELQLLKEGYGIRDIARITGRGVSTIQRLKKNFGIVKKSSTSSE